MVSGSQLQVAKLAQMCPAAPSGSQRHPAAQKGAQRRTVDEFQRKKIGVYNLLNRQILRLIQTRTVNFGRQSLI